MLRGATSRIVTNVSSNPVRLARVRRLHSTAPNSHHPRATWLITSTTLSVTVAALYLTAQENMIYNDAPSESADTQVRTSASELLPTTQHHDGLATIVWGSNKTHTLDDTLAESIRVPVHSKWFNNVALRDLAVHERHAACVDVRGDIYQWGDGFIGNESGSSHARPQLTLKGKNITQVQLTRSRVYALSASGHIYVLSSHREEQALSTVAQTPIRSTWWGTGRLWGEEETIDYAQVTPSEKLKRGERFVQISTGSDHLLALTSEGRTFAHPITLNANSHGQLGFRKCDVPSPVALSHIHLPSQQPRVPLELTPRVLADPYARATPGIRPITREDVFIGKEAAAAAIDDKSIRWSDKLFEIPALKEVKVDHIAAGSRNSFAKTPDGRVLGWGANNYGQIGLGAGVTLEAITVPTEIILWRTTPGTMKTKCLNMFAGGDLTMFVVERRDGGSMPYVDVLACGNGQYGGLGNALYSNAQYAPVRAKNVSGLLEYDESTKNLQAIVPEKISISPTGHVLLTLDTRTRSGQVEGGGKDVVAWGSNYDYQVGTGRRGSMAVPTALQRIDGGRFMLQSKRASEVRDMQGKVWQRGVRVEQKAIAGWNNSVVYWRIL